MWTRCPARERAGGHVRRVRLRGLEDRLAELRVRPRVAGHEGAQPEQVGDDEDLAARAGAGADADRGDAEPLRDGGGQLLRNELQDHRERAGFLDRQGVVEERAGLVAGLALDADLAAHPVLGLRGPADVAHGRDAGADEGLDDAGGADAALDLDGLGAAVLEEPARVLERLVGRGIRRNGMSPTTSARCAPRTTARVWWSISAIVTRTVES